MASKIVNNTKRYFRFVYQSNADRQIFQIQYIDDKFPKNVEVIDKLQKLKKLHLSYSETLICISVFEFNNKEDFENFHSD